VGARALLTDGQEAQRTIGTRLTFQSPFEVEFEQASEAVMLIWAARRLCWINTLDFLQSLLSISKYRGGRIRGLATRVPIKVLNTIFSCTVDHQCMASEVITKSPRLSPL